MAIGQNMPFFDSLRAFGFVVRFPSSITLVFKFGILTINMLTAVIKGSAIINSVFAIIYALGKWLASRLQDSKCKSDNNCFQCESSLSHLKTIRETNDLQLEQIRNVILEIKELKNQSQTVIEID